MKSKPWKSDKYRTAILGHGRMRYINTHRRLGLATAREGSNYMRPSTNRLRSAPLQGANTGSNPVGCTIAQGEISSIQVVLTAHYKQAEPITTIICGISRMAQAAGLGPVEETRAGSSPVSRTICANDGMVDMAVSKAAASDGVWVQVPLCAPKAHTAIFLFKILKVHWLNTCLTNKDCGSIPYKFSFAPCVN